MEEQFFTTETRQKPPLMDFAYLGNIKDTLTTLKEMAVHESWDYSVVDERKPLPILNNYLNHTFSRIKEEGKLATSGDFKCFNTGLVTENQQEIFMSFKSKEDRTSFEGFYTESDSKLFKFSPLPDRASYFDDPAELIFDLRLDLRININHIIDDPNNFKRFPDDIRRLPKHQLLNTFSGAIEHAKKRVKRNYKTAIPQYYRNTYIPDAPQLQLLLPLCLSEPSKADLALAVYRVKNIEGGVLSEFYSGKTCLTLDWAVNNARLIAKPDEEWLRP